MKNTFKELTKDYREYLTFDYSDFEKMENMVNEDIEIFKAMTDERNHNCITWHGFEVWCDFTEFNKGYEDYEDEPLNASFDCYKDVKLEYNTFSVRVKFWIKSDGHGNVTVEKNNGCYLYDVIVKEETTTYIHLF